MLLPFLRAPRLSRLKSASPTEKSIWVFVCVFLLAILNSARLSYRDPSSLFFVRSQGYKWNYSAVRQQEAREFIRQAALHRQPKVDTTKVPHLCVGIATVAREGARYFEDAVGSLLEGLSPAERARIHLTLFIAHTNPSVHPAYGQKWLSNVADTQLKYDLSPEELEEIGKAEAEHGLFRTKGIFDYTYLMRACQATKAAHVLILEDDILLQNGWFPRTVQAMQEAQEGTVAKGYETYLYIRLFFTETFFGWNSEEWPIYLQWSLGVSLVVLVIAVAARSLLSNNASVGPFLAPHLIRLYVLGFVPALILLFFATGRMTVLPLRHGVIEMPNFGCCSQGLLFPARRVDDIYTSLRERRVGFVDQFIEDYAKQHNELRWAMVPSVMQHVGSKSSKKDDDGPKELQEKPITDWIWNYEFETLDWRRLRRDRLGSPGYR